MPKSQDMTFKVNERDAVLRCTDCNGLEVASIHVTASAVTLWRPGAARETTLESRFTARQLLELLRSAAGE